MYCLKEDELAFAACFNNFLAVLFQTLVGQDTPTSINTFNVCKIESKKYQSRFYKLAMHLLGLSKGTGTRTLHLCWISRPTEHALLELLKKHKINPKQVSNDWKALSLISDAILLAINPEEAQY